MSDFHVIANELAELLTQKNESYGSAYATNPKLMSILYPHGILPEDYPNVLAITRIFDKLQRIATDNAGDTEDPWKDIAGYALLRLSEKRNADN